MNVGTLQPVSNREDWIDDIEVRDENDALVDLSSATIVMTVSDRETKAQVLSASTTDGKITLPGTGIFSWSIPVTSMHSVCPETYDVGITIKIGSITTQFLIGTVAIMHGVVP